MSKTVMKAVEEFRTKHPKMTFGRVQAHAEEAQNLIGSEEPILAFVADYENAGGKNVALVATPSKIVFAHKKMMGSLTKVFPWRQIETIHAEKKMMKSFVTIQVAGQSHQFKVHKDAAQEVANELLSAQDQAMRGGGGTTEIHQAASAADELKKFKDLLDAGIISEDEFNAKKSELLGL